MPELCENPPGDVLARCLVALGADAEQLLGFDVLAAGASGAGVYRLRFPYGDRILKVTLPESTGYLRERARREIQFYWRLASEVCIQVPRATASRCDSVIGACLLLDAYDPAPAPRDWTETMYLQAAALLGRFHASFWGRERELASIGWLRRTGDVEEADIRRARCHWKRLGAEPRFETILTQQRYTRVLGRLGRLKGSTTAPPALPFTLCHGDFHIDNILRDSDGEIVLADWQEVGPGRGPEDLSFFVQRASFAGGTVPVDDMIDVYRRSLAASVSVDVPARDIRRAMEIAELRTRLLHWPAFLADASEDQLSDLLDRIDVLADGLETPGWREPM